MLPNTYILIIIKWNFFQLKTHFELRRWVHGCLSVWVWVCGKHTFFELRGAPCAINTFTTSARWSPSSKEARWSGVWKIVCEKDTMCLLLSLSLDHIQSQQTNKHNSLKKKTYVAFLWMLMENGKKFNFNCKDSPSVEIPILKRTFWRWQKYIKIKNDSIEEINLKKKKRWIKLMIHFSFWR